MKDLVDRSLSLRMSTNASNPFGRYYAEILRGEGFNAFSVTDISKVTADTLTAYDVVLLGEMSLNVCSGYDVR